MCVFVCVSSVCVCACTNLGNGERGNLNFFNFLKTLPRGMRLGERVYKYIIICMCMPACMWYAYAHCVCACVRVCCI